MASFKIHTKALRNECENLSEGAKTLKKYVGEINKIAAEISLDNSTASVKKTLSNISEDVRTESVNLALLSTKLDEIIVQYENAERNIVAIKKVSVEGIIRRESREVMNLQMKTHRKMMSCGN